MGVAAGFGDGLDETFEAAFCGARETCSVTSLLNVS